MTEFGSPRRHAAECGSTNDLARAWASDPSGPAPHGALVTAGFQTRGRGRRGHHWEAGPAQSALMSFVLRPQIPLAEAWQLGFLAALAAAEALDGMGLEATLKWPNDVLLQGAKVAGVLVENVSGGAAIAGIGLNVNQTGFESGEYQYPPTSLRLAAGREFVVEDVIKAVASAFGGWDNVFQREGFVPVLTAWRARLAVNATVRRGAETGTLAGVTDAGRAWVHLPSGTFAEWTALEE